MPTPSKFAHSPIGVVFDPDRLAARYKQGVPEEKLLERPDGPVPELRGNARSS